MRSCLFPLYLKKVISSSKYLNFTETGFRNFHLSLTVQQKESIPKGTGGACWIRCSDVMLKGQGREKGFLIIPGSKILRVDNGAENEIFDLSGLDPSESIQFDIIRLDGVVFIYADKEFLFSFPDEIPGEAFISYSLGDRAAEKDGWSLFFRPAERGGSAVCEVEIPIQVR